MKKISLLLFLMCMVSLGAMAKCVVFTLMDGTLVYYQLGGETNPMMRFVDGKVTVNADVYELSGIKNFYISPEDDPTGVEDALADKKVEFKSNCFVVKAKAAAVNVFAANGAKVEASVAESNGYVSVDMNGLAKGTYIINVGDSSFKVMKK